MSEPTPQIPPTSSNTVLGRESFDKNGDTPRRSSRSTRLIPRRRPGTGSSSHSRPSLIANKGAGAPWPGRSLVSGLVISRPHAGRTRGREATTTVRKRTLVHRHVPATSARAVSVRPAVAIIDYFIIGPAQFVNGLTIGASTPSSPSATRWSTASSSSSTSPTATSSWSARSSRCRGHQCRSASRRASRAAVAPWSCCRRLRGDHAAHGLLDVRSSASPTGRSATRRGSPR